MRPTAYDHAASRRLERVPDLLALHARDPDRYPFLLESPGGASGLGRFDILFAFPGERLVLGPGGLSGRGQAGAGGFLSALDDWWRAEGAGASPGPGAGELPFRGGWFVFLAYELATEIEPRLGRPAGPGPFAIAVRVPAALIVDRGAGVAWATAEPGHDGLLGHMVADAAVAGAASPQAAARGGLVGRGGMVESDPAQFLAAVRAVQAHVAAGDIYQANISREWRGSARPGVEPWMLYERLRAANPAPFAGLACLDGLAILSSSPERLLRIRDGRIDTRPIAGTCPRRPGDSDTERRAELVGNAKERAEHVMLIDLERSDLGRVCEPGSVHVEEFMVVETYAHVHHIVSGVSGRLRAGTTPGDAIRAVFPGGTITGCPKVRCMEIIRDLEARPRGAYTGSMGYLNRDGSADLNILIRTIVARGGELSFAAGSGIVADSEPDRELEETRAKARGLLLALEGMA